MAKVIPHLAEKARYSFWVTLALLCTLLLLIGVWNLTRATGINWTIWAIQCGPLLLLAPGLLKKYYRSYSWLCFVLLFYFIRGVESVLMSTAKASDGLFLLLVVLLFVSSMFTSRWLQRVNKGA